MIFDDTHNKIWKPIYIQIIRLWWAGNTRRKIADDLGISIPTVSKIIDSDTGKHILSQLESNTFDSIVEAQTMIQAAIPDIVREKINLALHSANESVRSKNGSDLLAIAGHVPTHHVVVERSDPLVDQYKSMNELDIRKQLLEIKQKLNAGPDSETGPDGKLVN
jgi:predicted transcriptional regulator